MKVRLFQTHLHDIKVTCDWETFLGKIYLKVDNRKLCATTMRGRLERLIKAKVNGCELALSFIPFKESHLGLIMFKKNNIIYKAVGFSTETCRCIPVSALPLASWK